MSRRETRAGPPVRIESLHLGYGDRPVLHDISLEVGAGEIVALLGPNGAGKSTLIRALCGRLRPDSGRISVVGADPRRSAAARRQLGLVPQRIALYPHLTVAENLGAFARLGGLPRDRVAARVAQTLATCALEPVSERRVDALSGGWQRRANIACGLVHGPSVLVLDEPTVGVDLAAREAVEVLLRRLADDGLTVLVTSHDLGPMERLADRVILLVDGHVVADGAPERLVAEAFGACMEWEVVLSRRPDESERRRLEALGLAESDEAGRDGGGESAWRGLVEETDEAVPGALEALPLREWHVRRPGLDSYWRARIGDRRTDAAPGRDAT